MNVVCNLVQKTSKDGKSYYCLELEFVGTTYKKIVFLSPAEKALLGV